VGEMTVHEVWNRSFQLWHYSVSYSQLLLRGIDRTLKPKRVDVLFSNVERMHVRSEYDSLEIEEIAVQENVSFVKLGITPPRHGSIFLINGGSDYVVATHCQWSEDDGGAHSPSTFGPMRGIE
jgi:hypothetical protein